MPVEPAQIPLQFAPVRGGRLAYQVFGAGAETVVAIPPTAQNIEVAWEQPDVARMLQRFGSFCRYLHFDKRGTGCSDRTGRIADIDERVDDVRAIMDHVGIERAHLFGNSEGGPMSLLFAATYPDRVASVVLFGSGATIRDPDLDAEALAELRARQRAYAARWGTPDSPAAAGFAPSLTARDPSFAPWHQRYERLAASQDALLELLELALLVDVREALPHVRAPVLCLHRRGDRAVALDRAEEVVAAVPDGRLLVLDGEDHFAYAGDVDTWMDEFERFVTGAVSSDPVAATRRPRVEIATLGRFAVLVDGEEVPVAAWGSRRARQLCKRLVVARGWPITRDELFDLLWPDETDRTRLGARLSVQLSAVRRILRGGVIADRDSVRLDLREVDTDLERFHRAGEDEAIVTAYGGELLPEDRYEPWLDVPRTEARNRFASATRRLAGRALRDGHPARAIELAERLLLDDRFDEAAHDSLVRALFATGANGTARDAHRRWDRAMRELGRSAPPFERLSEGQAGTVGAWTPSTPSGPPRSSHPGPGTTCTS